jgi:hypothetical protein
MVQHTQADNGNGFFPVHHTRIIQLTVHRWKRAQDDKQKGAQVIIRGMSPGLMSIATHSPDMVPQRLPKSL